MNRSLFCERSRLDDTLSFSTNSIKFEGKMIVYKEVVAKINKLILLISFLGFLSPLFAQQSLWFPWNKKPTNLQVLPEGTDGLKLRDFMGMFVKDLGVRCIFCHDDSKAKSFEEIDFASDAKKNKIIAREMYKMLVSINKNSMPSINKLTGKNEQLRCFNCHHGTPDPRPIQTILEEKYANNGIQATIDKFKQLRDKYYSTASYDFSQKTLNRYGYALLGKDKIDDAIKILSLNAEYFPSSWNIYDSLGEAYMEKGEKEIAVAYYQKSLTLNPKNDNAVKMLRKLKSMK